MCTQKRLGVESTRKGQAGKRPRASPHSLSLEYPPGRPCNLSLQNLPWQPRLDLGWPSRNEGATVDPHHWRLSAMRPSSFLPPMLGTVVVGARKGLSESPAKQGSDTALPEVSAGADCGETPCQSQLPPVTPGRTINLSGAQCRGMLWSSNTTTGLESFGNGSKCLTDMR